MKLSLVVSQGVNAGKTIRISVADFLIGRDPECHLRPASPAVSKQHSGIATRDGKVYVRDCGSTNGTFVNGEQIAGEREVKNGDALKVGPLEFTLSLEADAPVPVVAKATPATAAKTAPAKKAEAKPVAVAAAAPAKVNAVIKTDDESHEDAMAALLLGMDDDSDSTSLTVEQMSADATTVMEMPALGATGATTPDAAKKDEKKKTHTDSASAAADALSKYMRRPRT